MITSGIEKNSVEGRVYFALIEAGAKFNEPFAMNLRVLTNRIGLGEYDQEEVVEILLNLSRTALEFKSSDAGCVRRGSYKYLSDVKILESLESVVVRIGIPAEVSEHG